MERPTKRRPSQSECVDLPLDAADHSDGLDRTQPRPIGEIGQQVLREIWWRQRRLGNPLPAERGVILIDGGAP